MTRNHRQEPWLHMHSCILSLTVGVAIMFATSSTSAFSHGASLWKHTLQRSHRSKQRMFDSRLALAAESSFLQEIEQRALTVADDWSEDVTDFMDSDDAAAAEQRLQKVPDMIAVRAGGYTSAQRVRLVLTKEELADALEGPCLKIR
eukprot:TRINITY_DN19048_c0_g1_i2.p1 TRINITY_DN19048_c0_g1~~TRINITY_DN19048_c0_g1_i2.p1  ORF type:complete len:147 (-),score=29.36 TRINITY_DN19048_c0_g1_i2:70-510(-)